MRLGWPFKNCIGWIIGVLVLSNGTSGFTSNTLLIPNKISSRFKYFTVLRWERLSIKGRRLHELYCYLTVEWNYLRSMKCLYNNWWDSVWFLDTTPTTPKLDHLAIKNIFLTIFHVVGFLPFRFLGQWNTYSVVYMLYILTSVWVLRTPNVSRNSHFQHFYPNSLKKQEICRKLYIDRVPYFY